MVTCVNMSIYVDSFLMVFGILKIHESVIGRMPDRQQGQDILGISL